MSLLTYSFEYTLGFMFHTAVDFDVAGQTLDEQQIFSQDPAQSNFLRFRSSCLGTPKYVSDAFAVELYLKCILHIEHYPKNKLRIHKLKELFNKLSVTAQHDIRIIYNTEVKILPRFQTTLSHFAEFEWHHKFELDDVLNDADDAFYLLRYEFEQDLDETTKTYFIYPLKVALYRYLIKLYPHLIRGYVGHS